MKKKVLFPLLIILVAFITQINAEELPIPTYLNSVIISLEHSPTDSTEVDYIKNNINFGLYAWPSFSITSISPVLDWHADLSAASSNIQSFKNTVNSLITAAKAKNVKLHLVLTSGYARPQSNLGYVEAKQEDIRNAQWFNDDKLAEDHRVEDSRNFKKFIWGTFSRYARKMRANLEAKTLAALQFLKEKMDENPDTLIAISGWGEAEFNYFRKNDSQTWKQDWFCDYSPFAILEFRDWIQHTGMYDDTSGKYKSEGWAGGGVKYQGTSGLNQFNYDFDTNFSTLEELKNNHWSLSDDYDSDPTDTVNSDPNKIPFSSYAAANMTAASTNPGGFDPPRDMPPRTVPEENKFWGLWNLFRETMVFHHAIDVAKIAQSVGISANRWFTHALPGDYMFGTNPAMTTMNARYFSSASALWAADIAPYGSLGATIYDVKFPPDTPWLPEETRPFARTTRYGLEAISQLSDNYAVLEYDAETYPSGLGVIQSSWQDIYAQFMRLYDNSAHLINFFRWWDESGEHRIKGMNKETALKEFVDAIRDKARGSLSQMFSPPKVIDFSVQNQESSTSRVNTQAITSVLLKISGAIWRNQTWKWTDWGDWKHFELYRGETASFPADGDHLLTTTTNYSYVDSDIALGKAYYYKIRAVNKNDVGGPLSDEIQSPGYLLTITTGAGGTTIDAPGIYSYLPGINISVNAVPGSNFRFSSWFGDVAAAAACGAQISVVMDQSRTITAQFCSKCGDVNGDNNITPGDALLAFNIYLRKIANPTFCQLENADVNVSGTKDTPNVTPGDAQAIFEKYLGRNALPGDCLCASRGLAQTALALNVQRNRLLVASLDQTSGEEIVVPVLVSQISNIKSFGFDIHYPAQALEFICVERGGLTQEFYHVDAVVSTTGTVRVGGYSGFSEAAGTTGELVRIVFRSRGPSINTKAFKITNTVDDLGYSGRNEKTSIQKSNKKIIKK